MFFSGSFNSFVAKAINDWKVSKSMRWTPFRSTWRGCHLYAPFVNGNAGSCRRSSAVSWQLLQSVKSEGGLLRAADEFGAEWKHAAGVPRRKEAKGRYLAGSAVPSVRLRLDGGSSILASWAGSSADPGVDSMVQITYVLGPLLVLEAVKSYDQEPFLRFLSGRAGIMLSPYRNLWAARCRQILDLDSRLKTP